MREGLLKGMCCVWLKTAENLINKQNNQNLIFLYFCLKREKIKLLSFLFLTICEKATLTHLVQCLKMKIFDGMMENSKALVPVPQNHSSLAIQTTITQYKTRTGC